MFTIVFDKNTYYLLAYLVEIVWISMFTTVFDKNIYYTLEISLQYYKEIYVYITKKICQIDEGTSKG